ncbi:TIGR03084 family protein [Nocardioides sp. HDW12B]|uniref:TIGR03084 family metal-binding protein n=1 Tax=Nocardioides sp. HDW12B TaxID=2714939 RepID=UPI001408A5BD|nr:TIGR03084 family metal-binding protein [Nocardioides sp. HDW12B]QIK67791.1 TIGR03084 family protein [Nocardioides sp. HDW12B]
MTDPKTLPILADLAVEGDALDALVADLDDAGWRTPTPAEGWDVATSVAHLAWTDEVAVAAATDKAAWDGYVLRAIEDPDGFVDAEALRLGRLPSEELLTRWRAGRQRLAQVLSDHPSGEKMPWFGPPMGGPSMASARFMETWAHGLDVAEALGVAVEPHDRVRHVVHIGVRTRGFAFANAGLEVPQAPVHVSLTAPGGERWEYGDAAADQHVTGPAWDFALLVTQRRHRDDLALTAVGPDADRWLDVAQAFAGPSGSGRAPQGAA